MAKGAEVARSAALSGDDASARRAAAFRALADRHLARSYGLARAILDDPVEAEDATHDAFVAAWRKWHTLRDHGRFEQWFDRILVNTCRNRLRHVRSHPTVHDISPELTVDPVNATAIAADRDLLDAALQTLSADQRLVVGLRYFLDLPVEQIAERSGIPAGTVKSRLHYGLRALRAAIGSDEEDDR